MSYLTRIQKAIDFIEVNLTSEISLEEVAQQASFSMYHFHRIFQSIMGETLKSYIRKRRLSNSAYELITTKNRIIDIAVTYQFETQESFTRSFKQMFGINPGKYRTDAKYISFYGKKSPYDCYSKYLQGGIHVEPKIIMKEAFTVVGIELVDLEVLESPNYEAQKNRIPQLWDRFLSREREIINSENQPQSFGICFLNGDGSTLSYVACLPVSSTEDIPEGMVSRTIPTQQYAVFTHKGTVLTLSETMKHIYGTWFPESGLEPALGPEFELYDDRFFGPENENSEVDIYVPVK